MVFPVVMGGYEKVKVAQLHPNLCSPMDYTVYGILQARILEWVLSLLQGNLPNPGIEPRSPALQAHSLPAEPQGKPKNTGVGRKGCVKKNLENGGMGQATEWIVLRSQGENPMWIWTHTRPGWKA